MKKLKRFLAVTLSIMMLLVYMPASNVKAEEKTTPSEIVKNTSNSENKDKGKEESKNKDKKENESEDKGKEENKDKDKKQNENKDKEEKESQDKEKKQDENKDGKENKNEVENKDESKNNEDKKEQLGQEEKESVLKIESVTAYDKEDKAFELKDGAVDVKTELKKVEVKFNKLVDVKSLKNSWGSYAVKFRVTSGKADSVLTNVKIEEIDGKTCVSLIPFYGESLMEFTPNAQYALVIPKTAKDKDGNLLSEEDTLIKFTTIKDETKNLVTDLKIDGESIAEKSKYDALEITKNPKKIEITAKNNFSSDVSNIVKFINMIEYKDLHDYTGTEMPITEEMITVKDNKCIIDTSSIAFSRKDKDKNEEGNNEIDTEKIYSIVIDKSLQDAEGNTLNRSYEYVFKPCKEEEEKPDEEIKISESIESITAYDKDENKICIKDGSTNIPLELSYIEIKFAKLIKHESLKGKYNLELIRLAVAEGKADVPYVKTKAEDVDGKTCVKLAKSFSDIMEFSPNAKYKIVIPKDIKFADETPIEAADVVINFETVEDENINSLIDLKVDDESIVEKSKYDALQITRNPRKIEIIAKNNFSSDVSNIIKFITVTEYKNSYDWEGKEIPISEEMVTIEGNKCTIDTSSIVFSRKDKDEKEDDNNKINKKEDKDNKINKNEENDDEIDTEKIYSIVIDKNLEDAEGNKFNRYYRYYFKPCKAPVVIDAGNVFITSSIEKVSVNKEFDVTVRTDVKKVRTMKFKLKYDIKALCALKVEVEKSLKDKVKDKVKVIIEKDDKGKETGNILFELNSEEEIDVVSLLKVTFKSLNGTKTKLSFGKINYTQNDYKPKRALGKEFIVKGLSFDLNSDEKINFLDLIVVTRAIGMTNKDEKLWDQYSKSDINEDGKIDEKDADLMKAYLQDK